MTTNTTLALPTVHLNGTSSADLLGALCNAADAVRAAIEAHAQTFPNGRDYYPQGDRAIHAATEQHSARWHKLNEVREELTSIALAILD